MLEIYIVHVPITLNILLILIYVYFQTNFFFSKYICILNYLSFEIKRIVFYILLKSVANLKGAIGGWPPYRKFCTIYLRSLC